MSSCCRTHICTTFSPSWALGRADRWSDTQTGFWIDGRLLRLNNAFDYLRFPALGVIDKAAPRGHHPLRLADRERAALEQIPVGDWLVRLSGRSAYERIWRPLLRAKLGHNHERASAAFIWAMIRRLYAARRSGLKAERFGYVAGGYARILERLAERAARRRGRIETRCPVHPSPGRGSGI